MVVIVEVYKWRDLGNVQAKDNAKKELKNLKKSQEGKKLTIDDLTKRVEYIEKILGLD